MKASFINCSEEMKIKFKESSCLLLISVGQQTHEDEKFLVTLKLVNKHFKNCTIQVGDSIQRHTMALIRGGTASDMYEQSLIDGELWIERNIKYIEQLTIPYNIIRWNKWLLHKDYQKYLLQVNELYESDTSFRATFYESSNQFIERRSKRIKGYFDKEEALAHSVNHVKEECVCLCLWVKEGYNYEMYPTKRNKAMDATYEKLILPNIETPLEPIGYRFKKTQQNALQQFYSSKGNKFVPCTV